MLVDTGPNSSETKLLTYLERHNIKKIDLCIFTHPDEDHIGNADVVLRNFEVERICMPPLYSDNLSYALLMNEADKKGMTPEYWMYGTEASAGRLTIKVLSPLSDGAANVNEGSLVMLLTFGENRMLFMADAGAETEKLLCSLFGSGGLDCDLLKVGHHGSSTATGNTLLSLSTPSFAVISCARHNSFGHPSSEVLARLKKAGASVYRTDESGDLLFVTDGRVLRYAD